MKLNYPWQLYHWHFELSSKCALACPRCPRTEMPQTPWLQKEISLENFKNILSVELLQDHVKRLTFCGDVGDPIYAKDFLKIIAYVKSINPKIHIYTITNGSYKTEAWWHEFAKLSNEYDTINFSIDGYDDESNNKYRVNSNWDSIINGVKIMSKHSSAHVYWAAIVFKFNENQLDYIKQLATDCGCDGLQLTYSTKFGSKYGDAYGGDSDDLEPSTQYISKTHRYERYFTQLTDRVQNNSKYLNHNTQLYNSVKDKYNKFITPMCLIGNRGLFVNAEQTLFPCSWTSFPYETLGTQRKSIAFSDSFFSVYRDALNIKKHGLYNVLNNLIWDKFFNSLNSPSCAWVECEQKCHSSLVDFDYAVGYLTN
jgi:MoaA/NifB/PqqE/SkfB family radical SAM enzyme